MARISVEQKALTDPRFSVLGIGLVPQAMAVKGYFLHALGLGAMIYVWNHCQERGLHSLHMVELEGLSLQLGMEPDVLAGSISFSGLGEWNAEKTEMRMRGTEGRIEWLQKRREDGQSGGRPRKTLGLYGKHPGANPPTPTPAPTPAVKKEPLPKPPKAALGGWGALFAEFWEVYPRKVAKQAAEKAWTKLAPAAPEMIEPTAVAIAAVLAHRKRHDWAGRDLDRVPYPATFLNAEKFEVQHEAV